MLTWVEISKDNLAHNLEQYKKISRGTAIWPVIKSNAYGHGLKEITQILDKHKNATGFMVANLSEAWSVKDWTQKPIMVLSYWDKDEALLSNLPESQISLPIYDFDTADYLDKLGAKLSKKFLLNIKIDTGTSRLGFRAEEAEEVIKYIQSKKNLSVFSIFSHFAESEAEEQSYTIKQLDILKKINQSFPGIPFHCACSAAAISVADSQMDMLRLGIGLYGLWPSEATKIRGLALGMELKPVLSWKTKIIQIKNIKKGESIGYNRTYTFMNDGQLAILPVGYNEGYDRSLSNKSEVLINGQRCQIRGNICMNLLMVELPVGLDVKTGDEAVLLGHDGQENISAGFLADKAQTINYEIVTRINPLLPRIVI